MTRVFDTADIGRFFHKIEKKLQSRTEGFFFSPSDTNRSATYEIHFNENTGYDENNPDHPTYLSSWLKNKLKQAEVSFTLFKHQLDKDPAHQPSKSIHIQFHRTLNAHEEALLMNLSPSTDHECDCSVLIPSCVIS